MGALGLGRALLAIGALLFAIALWTHRPRLLRWAMWARVIGGTVFLLFGAMNFYTHIGMSASPDHARWSGAR